MAASLISTTFHFSSPPPLFPPRSPIRKLTILSLHKIPTPLSSTLKPHKRFLIPYCPPCLNKSTSFSSRPPPRTPSRLPWTRFSFSALLWLWPCPCSSPTLTRQLLLWSRHRRSSRWMSLLRCSCSRRTLYLAARMLESSYDLFFGKLALKGLFEDYFDKARHFNTMIMLKPIDDPHVDLVATLSGPLDHKAEETINGNAFFRWQSDVHDPHTFVDIFVSNSDPVLQMRACAYDPKYGFGAFCVFPPLLKQSRLTSEDFGVMGLRYGSANLSIGATVRPFCVNDDLPRKGWLVMMLGSLTAGVQYEPEFGSKDGQKYRDLKNWSGAIGYGVGSGSPLSPSFNFGLELSRSNQFIASFYQHVVVQRQVKNPKNQIVWITNYIDFGFELQSRLDRFDNTETSGYKSNVPDPKNIRDPTFQVAASWIANENCLLKGKVGPLSSSLAFAFKSWWKPSFTFSISAVRDHVVGNTAYGFGIRVENIRQASYERADPNYKMLTPTKEHLAEGIVREAGKRPMPESNINAGNRKL